ncbi:MAG: 5-formyltetrahydrofolate cyclo-ligase [Methyloceanibacter sp.]
MRGRLLAERLKLAPAARRGYANEIVRYVRSLLEPIEGRIISLYWPIRAEPDLRALLPPIVEAGGRCSLPVVVEEKAPMVFRLWEPGIKLVPGIWNIPVPPSGAAVIPDIVIAPVVGYDAACFRLGYGGGYFDRTFVSLPRRPVALGVGYAISALPTIYPFPHDIALDAVITEQGIAARRG